MLQGGIRLDLLKKELTHDPAKTIIGGALFRKNLPRKSAPTSSHMIRVLHKEVIQI